MKDLLLSPCSTTTCARFRLILIRDDARCNPWWYRYHLCERLSPLNGRFYEAALDGSITWQDEFRRLRQMEQ
jgi:hypothetical protein